jgi:6-phosphogluconolactonase/glucosamine-6-phosphate isomerase/deaminase
LKKRVTVYHRKSLTVKQNLACILVPRVLKSCVLCEIGNTKMSATRKATIRRRSVGENVWLAQEAAKTDLPVRDITYDVQQSEEAVGRAMLDEIHQAAAEKNGPLVIVILGGRGGQALHRLLGAMAKTSDHDALFSRLHVFTQDALAPLRMDNGLSFVRDFERLLGDDFFRKVKSFTSIRTDAHDLEQELVHYVEQLESLGGIDLFFLGLGPEAGGASHLAYIKPGSGATYNDVAGLIPISASILEHHINKFKAGGTAVTEADEAECRAAKHILTLGPAAILGARRIVQSIVDAGTAPAKVESYRQLLNTKIADDAETRQTQFDQNPGLWLRVHPNVRSLILPNVLGN